MALNRLIGIRMIYYCFRDTEDWENKGPYQGIEHFWGYNRNRESRFGIFKEFFDLWNELQSVSYFQFRHELKELARLSFENLGIPEIPIDNWRDLQDDDWIVPQDDDDWVGPDLKTLIEETKGDYVIGDVWMFNSREGFGRRIFMKDRTAFFPSCGQAFRMGMFRKHFLETDISKMLEHHGHVKKILEKEKIISRITEKLPLTACRVAHTGSASYMWFRKNMDKFASSQKLDFECPDVSKQPEWCRKYMKEFKKLTDRFSKEIKMQ